jgi:hypothetical protein
MKLEKLEFCSLKSAVTGRNTHHASCEENAETKNQMQSKTEVDKSRELSLGIPRTQGSFDYLLSLHDLTLICILHTVLTAAVVTQTL